MKYLFNLFLLCSSILQAQSISWEYLEPMPEKVTNNAVASVQLGDEVYLYSFAGIDTTLDCLGDHLRAYRYRMSTDAWVPIADLPDALGGKIAAGASVVKDKVYIIGGYHLAPNCSEVSSSKVHVFDPATNTYLADGADIPVPIDDQVQVVWRDSLIYVITGWSNTGNISNVQVYNPSDNTWQQATPVNNSATWRVFGGSGSIVGDTIYYAGGARSTSGFSATSHFRKGYINPENPLEITWEGNTDLLARGYRMGAATYQDQAIWIGGSDETYNFDALAYNGSGVVPPLDRILRYDSNSGELTELLGFIPAIMDLRGVGELGNGEYLIAGGMLADQMVSNQLLHITIGDLTDASLVPTSDITVQYFPNPSRDVVQLKFTGEKKGAYNWRLLNHQGQLIRQGKRNQSDDWELSIGNLPVATYWLQLSWTDGSGQVIGIQKL